MAEISIHTHKNMTEHVWDISTLAQFLHMKNLLLIAFALCLSACQDHQNTFYVRTDGHNTNTGTENTSENAWQTIDYAISKLQAGDQLFVEDGLYLTTGIQIRNLRSEEGNPTRIASMQPYGAVITRIAESNLDSSVVNIDSCAHLIFSGFEVYDDMTGNESGIDVRNYSHHVSIEGCYVHDCACGGISSRTSDYLTFDGNVVRDNAKRNKWNCSGISIWHPIELDQSPGYHIQVINNIAFENECELNFSPHGFNNPTDGNGIIMDDFRNTQGGGQEGGYFARSLVANNLSFNNGGRGINVYETDNVDVFQNTTYHNLRVLAKYIDFPGEITVAQSNGSRVANNIGIKIPGLPTSALRCYSNDSINTEIFNNIFIGKKDVCGQQLSMGNNVFVDEYQQDYLLLKNATIDVDFQNFEDFYQYFKLTSSSPAIQFGDVKYTLNKDQLHRSRMRTTGVDIGCYAYVEEMAD